MDVQQRKGNITLQSGLEFNLDVEIQAELETDGFGVG